MTPHILEFVKSHKDKLTGRIIEVGSYDVNGSVRSVIDVSVGTDLRNGRGVDLVAPVSDLLSHFPEGSFDGCVSTETLEHVKDWKGFVKVTWDLVKDGGYLVMTMASKYKGRHAYPDDYWRFELEDIYKIYPNAEWVGELPAKKRPTSIGWVVKKTGTLGSLDFEPIKVK